MSVPPLLGVILCKFCGYEIDTVDTEKVTTYYSDCKRDTCLLNRNCRIGVINTNCN
ncbi:GapA-binding peptide SR1P [Paenibacillus sp. GD4]|uniref:GapA-binding peptide SR1P n=1 Tax=Paenibacillus sp. GD4 TaxID=3068890 RepID=UPI002796CCCA|nr:GapA-binding peptide SR1P [Paenibacillus sp. GD4]MDQ1913553.1 GapA-binding peptide SR1P [Paenibacillus sp. GD4]